MISSTADWTIVAPIINNMLLFVKNGNPSLKFPTWSAGRTTTALNATVATNHPFVINQLNTAIVFVDPHNFTVMDFGGLSLTGPIWQINIDGAGTGPATYAAATVLTPAQVTVTAALIATAANQALVAQQTAAAAALFCGY